MPVYIDILENKVLGREYKRGFQEGQLKAELKGELKVLRKVIEKRFGPIPAWAEKRLASLSGNELEALTDRVLDTATIEALLQ